MTDPTPDPSALFGRPDRHEPDQPAIPGGSTETELQASLVAEAAIGPLVGILVGGESDLPAIRGAEQVLKASGVPCEVTVLSAHRDPMQLTEYCRGARGRGLRVIIAAAGLAAALPGVAASQTDLPVIGVPLTGALSAAGGLDALLSIAQMPPGVPVATVGVNNAENAAHLALRMLAI